MNGRVQYECQFCARKFVTFVSRKAKFCSRKCVKDAKVFIHDRPHTEKAKNKCRENANNFSTRFSVGHIDLSNGIGWFKKGQKPWNWQGGERTLSQKIKDDVRWKKWRKSIFQRDNYTCRDCKNRGSELHPHHIKSKVRYPELAFELSNGVTLCVDCHKKTDNYGALALK